VPGDILFLNEGDKVPADARILEETGLSVNETILTGESVPVKKTADKLEGNLLTPDQVNMLFSGTYIIEGNVRAVVVNTGLKTELGKVADKISQKEEKLTPLQHQLNKLSQIISIGTIAFCFVILLLGVIRGQSIVESLVQSLSLAVAFIPEGLSAVMTVTLAIGINEMVKKNVIIKRLLAAESLGSVSILATDKTGTITTGKMSLEKIWTHNEESTPDSFKIENPLHGKILEVIKYCNNAKGATEDAMVQFLNKLGLEFDFSNREKEHKFSSELKRMTIIRGQESSKVGYSKGAPEVLIPLCSSYVDSKTDKIEKLTPQIQSIILNKVEDYASQGYRVLCLGYREYDHNYPIGEREKDESGMIFLGLLLFIDPLREEVADTVSELKSAGVRPLMITGDHPEIARTIALEAGIIESKNDRVITGRELENYVNGESGLTKDEIINTNIFARVTPDHKSILVKIFKEDGLSIGMAGDGINDAVAISKSDIGIGVVNATDVVKEASDVVITGNYNALASAVEVGRTIIFRTRLYLNYLLSGNASQVGVFTLALLLNYPAPLTAISLLMINILTDAAPAMAMAFEKPDKDLMKEKPRTKSDGIINKYILGNILIQGIISSLYLFVIFMLTLPSGLIIAQTATFTGYIFQKLFRGFTARSFKKSIFEYGFFSNKILVVSVLVSFIVWFLTIYTFGDVFGMEPLNIELLVAIIASSLVMPIVEEVTKCLNRKN
jgi:Ca2+-transporting ATPase